ncbi:MAG: TlpA disulfide reductase family protein [Bacteroidales bacterium]
MAIKNVLRVIVITFMLFSCTNEDNIIVKGTYPSGTGEYLRLEMLNISETQFIDSVKINRKGDFRISLKLDNPELILIKNARGQYINLLAFPDDNIKLNIPAESFRKGYAVSGSEESEKIRLLVKTVNHTRKQLDSITDAFDSVEDPEGAEAEQLITAYQKIFMEQKKNNIRFVVENLGSLASVYALYQRISDDVYILNNVKDLQYFKIVADSMRVKYPGSTLTTSLVNDVEQRLREYKNMLAVNELSKHNIVEAGMIDLTIEDPEENEISLGSLRGKVVLLNFWASWNSESRDFNNRLTTIYDQYHDRGFEVYSVALDSDKSRWRNAIFFEEYPWINVCELTYPYSYAATLYNVTSLPANYLIDKDANIVAKNIAGKTLATYLDNLL